MVNRIEDESVLCKKKIEIVRLYIENKNIYKEKDGAISYIS